MRVDGYYVDIENLEPDQAYTVGVSSQNLNDLTEYTTIRQRTSKITKFIDLKRKYTVYIP